MVFMAAIHFKGDRYMYSVQRRFQRIKTNTKVRISAPIMGGVPEDAEIMELGLGGCLVSTSERIGVGRMLVFYMEIDNKEVSAVAKILYEYSSDEGRINSGAEFLDVNDVDMAHLSGYIKERLPA